MIPDPGYPGCAIKLDPNDMLDGCRFKYVGPGHWTCIGSVLPSVRRRAEEMAKDPGIRQLAVWLQETELHCGTLDQTRMDAEMERDELARIWGLLDGKGGDNDMQAT